jgi:hypothetical protein
MQGIITMRPSKADPQGLGSAATYARRYALSAILGIVTDDDDDGNASSQPIADRAAQAKPAPADDKPWLNAVDKQGVLTEKGFEVVKYLSENTDKSLADIRKKYKVSKADEEAITKAIAEVANA